jgi:hypothetical protein
MIETMIPRVGGVLTSGVAASAWLSPANHRHRDTYFDVPNRVLLFNFHLDSLPCGSLSRHWRGHFLTACYLLLVLPPFVDWQPPGSERSSI